MNWVEGSLRSNWKVNLKLDVSLNSEVDLKLWVFLWGLFGNKFWNWEFFWSEKVISVFYEF